MIYDLVVIGGGAGGCFAAIRLAEFHSGARICILEAARKPLSKVEISGGGRCNVTHACYDAIDLSKHYPRGESALVEAFRQFQPEDMIKWFAGKGVKLKTEQDGRVFPVTDSSLTIINCFLHQLKQHDIALWNSTRANSFSYNEQDKIWTIELFDGRQLLSKTLLVSSGSDQRIWDQIKALGLSIISPVPSLFTFNIKDVHLHALMGISMEYVKLTIPAFNLKAEGPLLITHWGLSGPAVLRLSAWGARELYQCGYVFDLHVNWLGKVADKDIVYQLERYASEYPKKYIHNFPSEYFPARLWKYLCVRAGIPEFTSGAEFGKKQMKRLLDVLDHDIYRVTGKSTFKEEFVTAGGVALEEIDMPKFASKKYPSLFLVGEVLNIDGITGGFNFQAAWTGAHLAAKGIALMLRG